MRRLINVGLLFILILAGNAAADWHWAPRVRIVPMPDTGYTNSNNAHCVAEAGNAVCVVFVRDTLFQAHDSLNVIKESYFCRSLDWGRTWGALSKISVKDEINSRSPSVGAWSPETLLTIYNDGSNYQNNSEGTKVYSQVTYNHGDNWTQSPVSRSSEQACHPSLFSEVYPGSEWTGHAVWNRWSNISVQHRPGNFTTGPFEWISQYNPVSLGSYLNDFPSLWSSEHIARCAWHKLENGNYTVLYSKYGWTDAIDTLDTYRLWDYPTLISEPTGTNWRPSIAFDGTYEAVGYEVVNGSHTEIWVAHREYSNGQGTWVKTKFSFPFCDDNLFRPNLFATIQPRRIYMVFTRVHSSTNKKPYAFYTSDGGSSWSPVGSGPVPLAPLGADSAFVCAKGYPNSSVTRARVFTLSNRSTFLGHREIRFRAAVEDMYGTRPVLAPNGSRKLVRLAGTNKLYRVLPVENFVSYEFSSDGGATWQQDAPDFGDQPTVAVSSDGNPWVSYLRNDSLFCAVMNPDSEWTIKTIFAGSENLRPGPPSLAVFQGTSGRLGNVVFPMYQSGAASASYVLFAQFDTLGNVVLDTISTHSDICLDSFAALTCGVSDTLHCTYQVGCSVYYRTLVFPPGQTQRPDTWSSPVRLNESNWSARHPFCEQFKDRVWATFVQQSPGGVSAVKRISRCVTNSCDQWDGLQSVSFENTNPKDWPVLSTSEVTAWAESIGGNWEIRARVRDSILNLTNTSAASKFPHIVADAAMNIGPSTDVIRVRWLWNENVQADTWEVRYCDQWVNVSVAQANATRFNNGRKLVQQNSTTGSILHAVYGTRFNAVYYAQALAGSLNWARSFVAGGDLPCIDQDYTNRLWVAYRTDENRRIRCKYKNSGSSSWDERDVYYCGNYDQDSTTCGGPALVGARHDPGSQNRTAAYVILPVYNDHLDSSYIVLVKVNNFGVQQTDTLDRAGLSTDSFPAIGVRAGDYLSVAWQKGTEIYSRVSLDSVRPDTNRPITWSNAYNLSNTSTRSRHPAICVTADTTLVVWTERDTGAIMAKGQAAGAAYDSWGDTLTVSNSPENQCDYATIAIGDTFIIAWQRQTNPNDFDVYARVQFGPVWPIACRDEPSTFPHVTYESRPRLLETAHYIHCLYAEEPSSNYYEVRYEQYELPRGGGGGGQSAARLDPNIIPRLYPAQPNPFSHRTTIRYQVNMAGLTRVNIYAATGRLIRQLTRDNLEPGTYTATWDARDSRNCAMPEGIYFVRLESPNYRESRKLVLTQ
jgi:hypothetical protein